MQKHIYSTPIKTFSLYLLSYILYLFPFSFLLLSFSFSLVGQESHSIHQNHTFRHYDRYVYNADERFHTSVKPFQMRQLDSIVDIDTVLRIPVNRKFWDIVSNRSLIQFDKDNFAFTIDPLMNFEYGKDKGSDYGDYSWINTRGAIVNASIGQKFSISTSFHENQASFADYRYDRIESLGNSVIPGQGNGKAFGDSTQYTKDYAWAEGYVSYSPNQYFNIQFGHGKHFFGDGYRSILLSDNSFNYPYLKITTDIWNIKYVNLWAQFQDLNTNGGYGTAYDKEWASIHYLDWSVTNWLNIAFFEAVVWSNTDSAGVHRGFDVNYANPVIFTRPVEFSVGSPDNALMGLNGKLTLFKNHILYGQFMIDEIKWSEFTAGTGWWGNKWAMQAGYKTFDLFKVKNLDIQTEFNYVRPYMYSHIRPTSNYGHYNQPLAHPLGSNFWESVSFVRYNYKRIFFEGRFSYALHGADTAGLNFGNDIFIPYTNHEKEYDNYVGQAQKVDLTYFNLQLAYLVNPSTNLNVYVNYTKRSESSVGDTKNQSLITFGLRTSLGNFYYDF